MSECEPITTELRRYMEAYKPVEDGPSMVVSRIGTIGYAGFMEHCDSIDAIHAQLEHDYKVACEVNERQDEQYADMVHKLNRAYEKNRNQRRQLAEVQEALHRRNEGELKARWQKEVDRLERENEDLRLQLESLMFDSRPMTDENIAEHGWYRALDADKKPIRLGDKVYQVKGGWVYTVKSISFYPDNTTVTFDCKHGFGSDSAHNLRHYHAPTVEDVLREMVAAYMNTPLDDSNDDEFFAEYVDKLRLAGSDDE